MLRDRRMLVERVSLTLCFPCKASFLPYLKSSCNNKLLDNSTEIKLARASALMFKPPNKSTVCLAQSSWELPEQPVTRMKTQPQQCHCPQAVPALHRLIQAGGQVTCSSPTSCWLSVELSVPVPGWLLATGTGLLSPGLAAGLWAGRCPQGQHGCKAREQKVWKHHLCFSPGWGREVNPMYLGKAAQPEAVPGGKEVPSRSDTCSRMETEHLKQVIHIFYKPKEPDCFCLHMVMHLCSRGGLCYWRQNNTCYPEGRKKFPSNTPSVSGEVQLWGYSCVGRLSKRRRPDTVALLRVKEIWRAKRRTQQDRDNP